MRCPNCKKETSAFVINTLQKNVNDTTIYGLNGYYNEIIKIIENKIVIYWDRIPSDRIESYKVLCNEPNCHETICTISIEDKKNKRLPIQLETILMTEML